MTALRPFLFALLLSLPAAAEVRFGIEISPSGKALAEGDQSTITVRVVSDEQVGQPTLKIEGGELSIGGGGSSSFQLNLGTLRGRARHDRRHRFSVSGAPGRYTIHASVKNRNGDEFISESVELLIRERTDTERASDPELHIRLGNQNVYVGQAIKAELLILPKNQSQFVPERNHFPKLSGEGFKASTVGKPYHAEPLNGHAAVGFTSLITPLKAGTISLSATFQPQINVKSATGIPRGRRFSLEADPVQITAKALPSAGRPADFSGALGSFKLDVQADPIELQIGEPIALRLSISGEGNFDFIDCPKMTNPEGWKLYNPSRMDLQRTRDDDADRLVFAQNIVPQSGKTEIPPFRLSVFDPRRGEYITLMTDPIPIRVTGTAPSSITIPARANQTDQPAQTSAEPDDILTATDGSAPTWTIATTPAWWRPGYWWTHAVLVSSLLIGAALLRVFRSRSSAPSGADDFPSLLAQLQGSELDSGHFYALANRCLAAWRTSTGSPIPDDDETFATIKHRHDYLNFAGNRAAAAESLDHAERQRSIAALRSLPPIA